jgi:uncharacterized protein (TIGR02246 family)
VGEDEQQIRRTLGEYSQRLDDGRFDEWSDLFADDARLVLMGRVTEGRDAIRNYMMTVQGEGRRGMHVTTNSLIEVDGESDGATATTDYLFVRPTAEGIGVVAAGRYLDQLVRHDGRWRFQVREITLLTAAKASSDG